jgi:phosphoglycerol transferase
MAICWESIGFSSDAAGAAFHFDHSDPMKQSAAGPRNVRFEMTCMAALLLALLYLVMRDMGIYPTIFGDEWTYSSSARLTPYKDALLPSYLYFSLFGVTSQCGDRFLECSRIINAVLFVAASPFIYSIARRVTTQRVAAAVALLSIAIPTNSYTAFFMPEAMYFLAFWVFSAAVFAFLADLSGRWLAVSAVVLGLMALIKVHALFLVPGYCCFLLYAAWAARGDAGGAQWIRRAAGWIALALALAFTVRMVGGYLFAGSHGLGLLGYMYTSQASVNSGVGQRIPQALANLWGHVMALSLLAGMPVAALVMQATHAPLRTRADRTTTALLAYCVLMLGVLLAVTVLFTAAVAGNGAESNARLHMRYYNFVLPLFLIFAGAQVTRPLPSLSLGRRLLVALPMAALIAYAYLALLPAFEPNYIDSPELYSLTHQPELFTLLGATALLTLAAWAIEMRRGAQLFLFVFAPMLAVVGALQVNEVFSGFRVPDQYVKAGVFARQHLTPEEKGRLVLVGSDAAMLFKTRFFVDDTRVQLLILPEGTPITPQALPPGPYWLLVMGDYPLPPGLVSHVKRRNFALLGTPPDPRNAHAVNFALPERDPDRLRLKGVSDMESWGRWSNAKTVRIDFAQPFPREMTLLLDAAAYGPNARQDFVVRIGQQEQRVRLAAAHGIVRLTFRTSGEDRTISIDVPQPVSPSQLGQSRDARQLGIGLYGMAVEAGSRP